MCRAAQGILYMIIRRFKKWAPLVLPVLIKSLQATTDIDAVKGALHSLSLNSIERTIARSWEYIDEYVVALFHAFDNYDRVPLSL